VVRVLRLIAKLMTGAKAGRRQKTGRLRLAGEAPRSKLLTG